MYLYIYIYIFNTLRETRRPKGRLPILLHTAFIINDVLFCCTWDAIWIHLWSIFYYFMGPWDHFLTILASKCGLETTLRPKWSHEASRVEKS